MFGELLILCFTHANMSDSAWFDVDFWGLVHWSSWMIHEEETLNQSLLRQ